MNTPRTSTPSSGVVDNVDITLMHGLTTLVDLEDGEMVVFSKEGATDLAQRILLFYGVPFCNRVEGAGVKD